MSKVRLVDILFNGDEFPDKSTIQVCLEIILRGLLITSVTVVEQPNGYYIPAGIEDYLKLEAIKRRHWKKVKALILPTDAPPEVIAEVTKYRNRPMTID